MGINGDADREQIKTYQSAMSFRTNNTERMRIASDGNVGIGITPEAHYTGYVGLDIGLVGSLFSNSSGTNVTTLTNNGFLNSNASQWTYKVTDEATMYSQVHGDHRFSTAASGSADAAITWSEKVRIQNTGGISFNGDTAAANALDDYEEGNFTPIFACAGGTAPSSQTGTGQYTKIGDVVHLTGQIAWSGAGSGGVNLRIAIPFNVISDARAGMAIGLNSGVSYTAGEMLHLIPEINTNVIYIVSSPSDGSGHNHLNFSNVKNTGSTLFSFSGSFHTRD
jgi:hypothetical protein